MRHPDVEKILEWQKSPLAFIRDIWGLIPERDNLKFEKGKHLTWQQYEIFLAVERSLKKESPKKISVRSGHGIGKTSSCALLILWFLHNHLDAQASCTAPTSQQVYDVLWKEIKKWIDKMPRPVRDKYEWTTSYVRITERPETWFARAATARKEAPEAFAGIHGEYVLLIGDESSGIPEEIFESGRGALTNENALVLLFGNPLRLTGYFYDTHNSQKKNWQALNFSSLDSPLVDKNSGLIQEIREKYGEESDEWKIRVLGEFPRVDSVDDKGYVPLLFKEDIKYTIDTKFGRQRWMAIDPAGEGSNKSIWVIRDNFKAMIISSEDISSPKSIAQKTINLAEAYQVPFENIVIDNFGEGANVAQEIALSGAKEDPPRRVVGINVGDKSNSEEYMNIRAEYYTKLKEWLRSGGELVTDKRWSELLDIRFRRELNGKLRIMSKLDMQKQGIASPDVADALMLSFYFKGRGAMPMEATTFYPELTETKTYSTQPAFTHRPSL